MAFDDWFWPVLYGSGCVACLGASCAARSWRMVYMSGLMGISLVTTVIIDWLVGYARAPLLVPECDAIIGFAVAGVAMATRSRLGWFVFAGFVAEAAIWALAFAYQYQSTRLCIEAINATFAARLLLIGGVGVAYGLARRTGRIDSVLRGYYFGGA